MPNRLFLISALFGIAFLFASCDERAFPFGCAPRIDASPFAGVTRALTAQDFAPLTGTGSQSYRGTLFRKLGDEAITGGFHFTLRWNGGNLRMTAFEVEHLRRVKLRPFTADSTPLEISHASCLKSEASGVLQVVRGHETERFATFSVPLQTCPDLPPVLRAAVIYSNDFSTFVGGDGDSFYWIGQKSFAPAITDRPTQLHGTWPMFWYAVKNETKEIRTNVTQYSPVVTVTEQDVWSGVGGQGTLKAVSPGLGTFLYNYTDGSVSPTQAMGTVLLSPDQAFILGVDFSGDPLYFGASRAHP